MATTKDEKLALTGRREYASGGEKGSNLSSNTPNEKRKKP